MKKLKITDVRKYDDGVNEVFINNDWAFNYYDTEMWEEDYIGFKVSEHGAMIYLAGLYGTWYTKTGEEIKGYLYFKPKGESGKLKVTKVEKRGGGVNVAFINNEYAFNYRDREMWANGYKGAEISGHEAMIYLGGLHGTWYTKTGEEIDGYLYFKPKGERKMKKYKFQMNGIIDGDDKRFLEDNFKCFEFKQRKNYDEYYWTQSEKIDLTIDLINKLINEFGRIILYRDTITIDTI